MTIGYRTNAIYSELVEQAIDRQTDTLMRDGGGFGGRLLMQAFGCDAGVLRQLSVTATARASATK